MFIFLQRDLTIRTRSKLTNKIQHKFDRRMNQHILSDHNTFRHLNTLIVFGLVLAHLLYWYKGSHAWMGLFLSFWKGMTGYFADSYQIVMPLQFQRLT